MLRLALASLCLLSIVACSGNEETSSEQLTPSEKSHSLHNGSAPIVTAGDEADAGEKNKHAAESAGLRVNTVLAWKRGDPLPSAEALAAAEAKLKDEAFAASEEGKKLKANLETINLLAKAAVLNARNRDPKSEKPAPAKGLPAVPSYDRDQDRPNRTMQRPDGDIEVGEAIRAITSGELPTPSQRDAVTRASSYGKLLAIAYACDLLIDGENNPDAVTIFEATALYISEIANSWDALDDGWKRFLSFGIADGTERADMLWRYSEAWRLLSPVFR